MPVIPVAQEGQRIQVGSPVPIGSGEEARREGSMGAKFGDAIFELGLTLAKTSTESADRAARLEAEVAANKLKQQYNRVQAEGVRTQAVNKPGEFLDFVQNELTDFDGRLNEALTSDSARKYYAAYKENLYADKSAESLRLGDDMVKERTKALLSEKLNIYSETMADQMIAKGVSTNKKMQDLSIQLLQIEADIADPTSGVPAYLVPTETKKAQANTVMAVVNRLKNTANFEPAKRLADFYYNKGLFDVDAADKLIKEISTEQYNYMGRVLQQKKVLQSDYENTVKTKQEDQYKMLREMFNTAKSVREREFAMDLVNKSDLTQQQINSLLSTDKVQREKNDDPIVSAFMDQILRKGATREILNDLNVVKGMRNTKLSEDGAQKIMQFYKSMQSEGGRDRRMVLSQYGRQIDAWEEKTMTAISDGNLKREHAVRVRQVKTDFMRAYMENPTADVGKLFETVVVPRLPGVGREYNPSLSTGENLTLGADPEVKAATDKMVKARISGDKKRIDEASKELEAVQRKKGLLK